MLVGQCLAGAHGISLVDYIFGTPVAKAHWLNIVRRHLCPGTISQILNQPFLCFGGLPGERVRCRLHPPRPPRLQGTAQTSTTTSGARNCRAKKWQQQARRRRPLAAQRRMGITGPDQIRPYSRILRQVINWRHFAKRGLALLRLPPFPGNRTD